GAVAHFTQSVDSLVGVDADEGAGHGRARHNGDAQIGDLQVGRLRPGIGILRRGFGRLIRPEGRAESAEGARGRAEESAPARRSESRRLLHGVHLNRHCMCSPSHWQILGSRGRAVAASPRRPIAAAVLFCLWNPSIFAKENNVRVGVFTPLLSQMSLDDVLKKLKSINIDTVELGTGNYPGDPHCKLSRLDKVSELLDFKKKL